MKKIRDGFYVVAEGIDGVGKSSQIALCSKILRAQYEVKQTREPAEITRQKLFEQGRVRTNSPDDVFNLYLNDHIEIQESKIKQWKKRGSLILQDRYLPYSHDCYWGEKNKHHIEQHDRIHDECVRPDLVILFIAEPLLAMERIQSRSIDKAKLKPWSDVESLKKIQDRYIELSVRNNDIFVPIFVDEALTADEISLYVCDIINHKIKKHVEKQDGIDK